MLAQLQQDYKLLQQKHDDFVFNATPLAVVEALEEEVTSLTDKLAKRSAKYMKFKSNAKGLGLETLDMRVENNELMQVQRVSERHQSFCPESSAMSGFAFDCNLD